MSQDRVRRHTIAYRYLVGIAVVGWLLLLVAGVGVAMSPGDVRWGWMAFLTVCLLVCYVAPIHIELGEEITTEQASGLFAVPTLAVLPWPEAVVVAGLASLGGYLARATPLATVRGAARDPAKVAFAGGSEAVGAAVGAGVVVWVVGDGSAVGWVVVAAGIGGLAWELTSRLLVAGFVVIATGARLARVVIEDWRHETVSLLATIWLGVALAGTAVSFDWSWVLILGVAAAVIPLSRTLIPVLVGGARLPQLFAAAEKIQAARDQDEVEQVLIDTARRSLFCEVVEIRDEPPTEAEIGVPIEYPDAGRRWLVCAQRRGTYGEFPQQERSLLQALAAVAAPALESAALTDRLREQALRDALTGLHNRRSVEEQFTMAVARAERRDETLGVLFIDLDHFKTVNDRFGHDVGDEALVTVGRRLEAATRTGDVCARQGGDEFLVLLTGISGREGAERVAAALSEELTLVVGEPSDEVVVSVTVGVAIYPDDGESLDELLAVADAAMYAAKGR